MTDQVLDHLAPAWAPGARVPETGKYQAFKARTREFLGEDDYSEGDFFECWHVPPRCAIIWSSKVTPILPCESEQPGRVPDDAAVAD